MADFATELETRASAVIPRVPAEGTARLDGLELIQLFGIVSQALRALQQLTSGAFLYMEPRAPQLVDGNDGDGWLNTLTGDAFKKAAGEWVAKGNLKGLPGKTPQKGVDYFDGKTPQKGVDYRDGVDGKSAYQLWLEQGNTGSLSAFINSLKAQPAEPGKDGNDITSSAEAPSGGKEGDVHFEQLATGGYRIHINKATGWTVLYSVATSSVADGSVTNAKLAEDAKVGSIAVAKAAFPQADRPALNSVTDFLVWIGPKITDLFSRMSGLDSAFTTVYQTVQGFAGRLTALESRPVGGTSTGGTGTASYPAQSAATANKYLMSSGAAGGESWAVVTNNRVGWVLSFKNEIAREQRFFKATQISRIERDAGLSTLSYSINGGTAVQVVFTNNVFAPSANTPLTFPAGALITWAITYNPNNTLAAFEVEGTETV